mgnify:FL=1
MNIYESYRIMELSVNASEEEIVKAFKKLAKQFHPDANPGNADWAHKKMSDLNLAYQTLLEYKKNGTIPRGKSGPTISDFLKNLFKKDGFDFRYTPPKDTQGSENNSNTGSNSSTHEKQYYTEKEEPASHEYYKSHPSYEEMKRAAEQRQQIIGQISQRFKLSKDVVDEGMFVYYQYKLHKVPLRQEGIGRLKYTDAKRLIKRGIMAIEKLHDNCPLSDLQQELRLYIDFVNLFVRSLDCKEKIDSYNNPNNVAAYRYYRQGSDRLNQAFTHVFFSSKTEKNIYQSVNVGNLLGLALQDFLRVSEEFKGSDYTQDAEIKTTMLDLFYQLYLKRFFN